MSTLESADSDSEFDETESIQIAFNSETVVVTDEASDKQGTGATKREALQNLIEALHQTEAVENQATCQTADERTDRHGDGPGAQRKRNHTLHEEGFSDQPSDRLRPGEETYSLEELQE